MSAMEHLEGVQSRRALVGPPEKSVLKSIDMRMEMFGSLVHYALEEVCLCVNLIVRKKVEYCSFI